MNKSKLVLILSIFLFIPLSYAEEESCGLSNLATCIPQKMFEYGLTVINAPLQVLLDMNKALLSEPVNITPFIQIWAIIIYILSLFYGLIIMAVGFNFILSSYSDAKRENAKEWLKNTVIMVIAVQSSFFIYGFLIEISASLTASILNLAGDRFFLLTADNYHNLGLEFMFTVPYLIVLFLTLLFLSIRYLIVAAGVVLFPIGLFFNFIPFLKSYGKLIINFLLVAIFLPFFQGIILLFGSLIIEIPIWSDTKIVISIAVFALIDLVFIFLVVFVTVKSAFAVANSDVGKAAKMVL